MHYYSIFLKIFNKPCVKPLGIWTKNANCWKIFRKLSKVFDENSQEKLNFFIFILENMLVEIEPSEITPCSKTIFRFQGDLPCPPGYSLAQQILLL